MLSNRHCSFTRWGLFRIKRDLSNQTKQQAFSPMKLNGEVLWKRLGWAERGIRVITHRVQVWCTRSAKRRFLIGANERSRHSRLHHHSYNRLPGRQAQRKRQRQRKNKYTGKYKDKYKIALLNWGFIITLTTDCQ